MKQRILFFSLIISLSISLTSRAQNVLDSDWDDVVDGKCDDQNAGWWSSAEAIRIAENVLLYQRDIGGWPKNTDMQKILSQAQKDALIAIKPSGSGCTIDNDATMLELTYLSKVFGAISDSAFKAEIETGFLNGIQYLLDAQYDNGGWPQFYPLRGGYSNHITYNDNAMTNVLVVLGHIAGKDGEYSIVVADSTVTAAGVAYNKGLECILKTQYVQKGILTSWCAQHHYRTMEPVMARSYELASLSGGESSNIIEFLMSIENPGYEVRRAIYNSVNWYQRVRISGIKLEDFINGDGQEDIRVVEDVNAPDLWARFYTLEDNTPFFCSRDGIKRYSLAEISYERRNGYRWYVDAGWDVFSEYDSWYPKWGLNTEQETVITSPASEAVYYFPETIPVSAIANEYAVGSITKFELYIDDVLISEFNNSIIDTLLTDLAVGDHSVIVESTDDQGHTVRDTSYFVVKDPTSISSIRTKPEALLCYPNPARSDFSIDLTNIGDSDIEIYNMFGRVVYQAEATEDIHIINDHGLASGAYLVRVCGETGIFYSQKLIIKQE
jgi:pectinesterase